MEKEAQALEKNHPSAAASLREGLAEMFNISRLGLPGPLSRCLCSTNVIESSFSGSRSKTRRVTHWQDVPLALSRSQDDKGRVRWTLFGNSEQGPGKVFWKSFFTAPGVEAPPEEGIGFFCRLLQAVYGENVADADGLRRVGFRILPEDKPDFPFWSEGELPSWAKSFLFRGDEPAKVVKYLVTFRPFGRLSATGA